MDTVAVSTRNRSNKGNKENAQPAPGGKALIKRDKRAVATFQMRSNEKELASVPLKAKPQPLETKSTSGDALKNGKTAKRDGKETDATGVSRRQTYSRAFLTEQAAKQKKILAEGPKQPALVQVPRSAPGLYKGKVVQSKIGSIWKSTASLDKAGLNPSSSKMGRPGVENVKKTRSKSVSDLPATRKPALVVSKRPVAVSKPPVTGGPAGFYSARPPTRTISATQTSTNSRKPTGAATKGSELLNSKPKIQVRDNKVNKPPVSSTISQYRLNMETTEERRAKLAEWLASKGKTLKRPVLTTAPPQKTKAPRPAAESHVEPQPAEQSEPAAQLSVEANEPEPAAADCADTQEAALTTSNQTPMIMNTSLDLLEISGVDLSGDPQDSIDDIVVNLCVALEEMATPSMSSDESDECKDLTEKEEVQDVCKKEEAVMKDECEKEVMSDVDESDEDTEEEDASVVKYNVKTTPYLQSVRKTIEGGVTSSRRKSNVKDLKFLTPVRRSTRIHRKSSHLPAMLMDHDPCVSSLAELMNMGEDADAYVCRKNPALLDELPGL